MPSTSSDTDHQHHRAAVGRRSRRTLYRDLIVSIILVVAGVFGVVVTLTYGYLSHKAEIQSADTLKGFSTYLQDSLELPIWNIDEEGINKICLSFFENALVARLKVTAMFRPSRNARPSCTVIRWWDILKFRSIGSLSSSSSASSCGSACSAWRP